MFNGPLAIEAHAREALQNAVIANDSAGKSTPLQRPFLDVMEQADAHPICTLIAQCPFNWAPPQTSSDPLYAEHSWFKAHVELLGPDGLAKSDAVRLGLYGLLPNSEYGIRTHPAEEVFVMLAGQVWWKRDTAPYTLSSPGERSHHASMMPHATRTGDLAFMSVYVWHGDLSTDNYVYEGLPED